MFNFLVIYFIQFSNFKFLVNYKFLISLMGCNNVKIIENNQISKKNENTKDLQDYPQFENSKVESNI